VKKWKDEEKRRGRGGEDYWLNIIIRQLPNQRTHRLDSIIYTLQQNRLVAYNNSIREQFLGGLSRDPGELVRMVEVCVQRNLLSAFPTSLY
jgi:hypothetical protein